MTDEEKKVKELEKMMRQRQQVAFEDEENNSNDEEEEEDESSDEEYDMNSDMPQLVDLLTSDDGDNIVEAVVKSLQGIQHAVDANTQQMEKLTQQVRALRKGSGASN